MDLTAKYGSYPYFPDPAGEGWGYESLGANSTGLRRKTAKKHLLRKLAKKHKRRVVSVNLTNDTANGQVGGVMLDSGFSAWAMLGKEALKEGWKEYSHWREPKLLGKQPETTYKFGAGEGVKPVDSVRFYHPDFGNFTADVVEGNLPLLVGRAFLRKHKLVLDFDRDLVRKKGKVIRKAHYFPFARTASELSAGPKENGTQAFVGTVDRSDASLEARSGRDAPQQAEAKPKRARNRPRVDVASDVLPLGKCANGECSNARISDGFDCGACYINVYTAILASENTFPEREIEQAILDGYLGIETSESEMAARSRTGQQSTVPAEQALPPLRERSGFMPLVSKDEVKQLNKLAKTPLWGVPCGYLRKLHAIRHTPADKMLAFLMEAMPLHARQRSSSGLVKKWIAVAKSFCETVVRRCMGCGLSSRGNAISRPIGLSIIPAFYAAMIDCFCLNHSQQWYALMVCDLGTGGAWAFVIRDAFPPTAAAVYVTYLTRYAVYYGCHRKVIGDVDSIIAGPSATKLWEELGIERDSASSFAHSTMGSVERKIGVYRWSIDRVSVESPPTSLQGWEVVLSSLNNQFQNEVDFSGTTPSARIVGRCTSILKNAITDVPSTGNDECNEFLKSCEESRKVYQQAVADRRLRKLLGSHLPKGFNESSQEQYPNGTKVAVWRERSGQRGPGWYGPAWILCWAAGDKYGVNWNGKFHILDRIHVKRWVEGYPDKFWDADPTHPPPTVTVQDPVEVETQVTGTHPRDPVDSEDPLAALVDTNDLAAQAAAEPAAPESERKVKFENVGLTGPDFSSLIHDPAAVPKPSELTCNKCKRIARGLPPDHKSHLREPGCLVFDPQDRSTWSEKWLRLHPLDREGGAEDVSTVDGSRKTAASVISSKNPSKKKRKAQARRQQVRSAAQSAEHEPEDTRGTHAEVTTGFKVNDDKGYLTFQDLVNQDREDLSYVSRMIDQSRAVFTVTVEQDGTTTLESKYLNSWENLPMSAKTEAMAKAIKAYDTYDSWHRGSEVTQAEMEAHQRNPPKGSTVVKMDCTIVRDAKIKCGVVIGKVRIVPRGFHDTSERAVHYSTSPTVGAISVRISELLGMRLGLKSWVFDISDAFFSGEYLRDDDEIWIKIPKEVLAFEKADESRPWRRLKREVPGCRGASSSWFRTLCSLLQRWGWEQLTVDKAVFVKRERDSAGVFQVVGICPVHVDDGKLRATAECAAKLFENFRKEKGVNLSEVKEQKLNEPVDFTGVSYCETEDGEWIDQNDYVKNKLQSLNEEVRQYRNANENDLLQGSDLKLFGTTVGRLIWVLPTHPKCSYEISYLSRYRAYPRVKHFRRIAQLVAKMKATSQRIFLPRLNRNTPLRLIAVVDAGAGEAADEPLKTRDHQCVAVMLATADDPAAEFIRPGTAVRAGLVSWQSCGLSRVSHSSFDFESIVAVSSLDLIINVRELAGEMVIGACPPARAPRGSELSMTRAQWRDLLIPAELHSDSMGLVKAVRLGTNSTLSSRRRRDVQDLQDCLESGDLGVFAHIDGPTNFADVGTKPGAKTQVAQAQLDFLVVQGWYYPKISKDYNKTFGNAGESLHLG